MTENDQSTEQLILRAAKKVFLKKGMDGARMQEIADEAGINKSLLHYYFRTKEKLFEAVLQTSLKTFVPRVGEIFLSELTFEKKIESFIEAYIDLLINNPHIPGFVLHELHRAPENPLKFIRQSGIQPEILVQFISSEFKKAGYGLLEPKHFFINLMALCIFPFIAKPILNDFFFENDEEKYHAFIIERKKTITHFVMNSLKNS